MKKYFKQKEHKRKTYRFAIDEYIVISIYKVKFNKAISQTQFNSVMKEMQIIYDKYTNTMYSEENIKSDVEVLKKKNNIKYIKELKIHCII